MSTCQPVQGSTNLGVSDEMSSDFVSDAVHVEDVSAGEQVEMAGQQRLSTHVTLVARRHKPTAVSQFRYVL